jgi:hypothetical protein
MSEGAKRSFEIRQDIFCGPPRASISPRNALCTINLTLIPTTMPPSISPVSSPSLLSPQPLRRSIQHTQIRHATLIPRPHRPYTFTQLVTLSDGSSYFHRTTSPIPVYKSTKDIRNAPRWNPRNSKLAAVEEDEAGRLAAFRSRFGGAFDAASSAALKDTDVNEEMKGTQGANSGKVEEKGRAGRTERGVRDALSELEDEEIKVWPFLPFPFFLCVL